MARESAGPLAHDRWLVALCGARVVTIGDELGPNVAIRLRRVATPTSDQQQLTSNGTPNVVQTL